MIRNGVIPWPLGYHNAATKVGDQELTADRWVQLSRLILQACDQPDSHFNALPGAAVVRPSR